MNKDEVICSCFRITAGDVEEAVKNGSKTIEDLQDNLGLGTACGSCLDEYEDELNEMLNK